MNRQQQGKKQRADAPQQPRKTPMDAALRYLGPRARTVREMELHLDSKQYGEYEVQQTVDRLIELGYLDDLAFSREFIRTRLNTKPVSRKKLREQLLGHCIPRDIADEALLCIDDDMEWAQALEVANKHAPQISGADAYEREQRLAKRLYGRGFSQDMCLRAAREALQENDHA